MAFIELQGVNIDFPLYGTSNRSLKKSLISVSTGGRIAASSRQLTVIRALDDINLKIPAGTRLGLLGHNGSGKSTLLKALAGVYHPTHGKITMQGRVASLLDISLGMDEDATGYENILIRGVYLGMAPTDMRKFTDAIAERSGLGEYLELPIRSYSSGMRMRLGFAISTSVSADILLMDEWLSVGDAAFQEKARERIDEIIAQAEILVLASHDPGLVEKVCNRIIKLEHGRIVSDQTI